MVKFELWDSETANRIGVYPDEAAALAEVRDSLNEDGPDLWQGVGLLKIADLAADDALVAEGDDLIALARGRHGGSPPVANAITRRRGSATTDARNIGMNAAEIVNAANIISGSTFLQSISGAIEMARLANEVILRVDPIPTITFPAIDFAAAYRSPISAGAISALAAASWDHFYVAESAGLRQAAEAIRLSGTNSVVQAAAEMAEQTRSRLANVALQLAQYASAAERAGAYLLRVDTEPDTLFIYERTGNEEYIAAGRPETDDTEGEDVVIDFSLLWRRDHNVLVTLVG